MIKLNRLSILLGGLCLYPIVSFAQDYSSNSVGLALMNLNAVVVQDSGVYRGDLWGRMRPAFRLTEVNPELVRRYEQYYTDKSDYFNRTVMRSQPYLYYIVLEVEKRKMPAEIALLPFIESAFVTNAKSRVGASGLWQFMPATGRNYGLEQTNLYDGRHDVYAATHAALDYLQYLHGMFGDWSLALAAYNWGEGSVSRAIARAQSQGLDPSYENLSMPNETRNYVPKLLAVRNLVSNPAAFGLNLTKIENRPYFKAVNIDKPLDIQAAARLANISEAEFLSLNPGFKLPVFMPKDNRRMLLPVSAAHVFENNYRKADKNELLSWNVYTAEVPTSLADVAMQTGADLSDIKRVNGFKGNMLAAGRSILLSKNTAADTAVFEKVVSSIKKSETQIEYTQNSLLPEKTEAANLANTADKLNTAASSLIAVQTASAESSAVADAAGSLSVEKVVQNALAQSNVEEKKQPAKRQTNKKELAAKTITHKVSAGDTLYSLALQYKTSVADLISVNKLKSDQLSLNQVLKVSGSRKK
ncbi:lytic transglycosylase [Stenoxybacter acetivorans]|uniref:lytic transglycosylase n=1 Tax=Stenoxybacter acetivorans TaxID=422441 RepID=UPI000690F84E|nr:transglycosylase SLT domain-containing protein [Stenoxybacter acetivorans]